MPSRRGGSAGARRKEGGRCAITASGRLRRLVAWLAAAARLAVQQACAQERTERAGRGADGGAAIGGGIGALGGYLLGDLVGGRRDRTEKIVGAGIGAVAGAAATSAVAQALPGSRIARVECLDGGERRSAIGLALRLARQGDAVAILGKGHERTQQLADRTIDFDDVGVVREKWAEIIAGGHHEDA